MNTLDMISAASLALGLTLSAPVIAGESADSLLQVIVAGYDRATLDRGGWRNAFVTGNHYAAGEPLLAAAIGSGVTTPRAVPADPTRQIAAR